MTTIKQAQELATDFFSAAPQYRTKKRLSKVIEQAIREERELAKELVYLTTTMTIKICINYQ